MFKRIVILFFVFLAIIGAFYFLFSQMDGLVEDEQTIISDEEELENMDVNQLIEYANNKPNEEREGQVPNPFGDVISQEELEEETFLKYIHYMSHQKVKAEQKSFFYEITDERIDWLIDAAQLSSFDDSYMELLQRWDNGDFSEVVNDHNSVYQKSGMESSERGEATDTLSPEEEQDYIENRIDLSETKNKY
ncbi:DUF6241 domain-containing protein [Oceanobacillus rekensis]|uniref:DUF6241 domain-containing protein n=1 Tax=Oceanobacillus rekensis TaxID=937927 RepID=UPI000B430EA7|nr:DUF6241 domain-containing protein [Oceanobacillus rekensis]